METTASVSMNQYAKRIVTLISKFIAILTFLREETNVHPDIPKEHKNAFVQGKSETTIIRRVLLS